MKKFLGLIPRFAEVTEEKLAGGAFLPSPNLNRVKLQIKFSRTNEKYIKQNQQNNWIAAEAAIHFVSNIFTYNIQIVCQASSSLWWCYI